MLQLKVTFSGCTPVSPHPSHGYAVVRDGGILRRFWNLDPSLSSVHYAHNPKETIVIRRCQSSDVIGSPGTGMKGRGCFFRKADKRVRAEGVTVSGCHVRLKSCLSDYRPDCAKAVFISPEIQIVLGCGLLALLGTAISSLSAPDSKQLSVSPS